MDFFWAFGFLIYTSSCAKFKKIHCNTFFLSQSMFLILVPYYCPILITLPNDQHACLALPTLPLSTHPFDCSLLPPSQDDKCNQRQLHLLPEVRNQAVSRVFRQFKMVQTWLKRKTRVEEFRNLTTTLLVPITRARKTATKGTHRPGWWFFIFVFSKIHE